MTHLKKMWHLMIAFIRDFTGEALRVSPVKLYVVPESTRKESLFLSLLLLSASLL